MVGVVISTMALFVVLSAFSGLISFNESFLNTADPDIKIQAEKGKTFILNQEIVELLQDKKIADFSKVIEEHALIENNGKRIATILKGVDKNYIKVNKMDTTLYLGEWFSEKEKNALVIGLSIANKIESLPNSYGESIQIFVPKPGKGQLTKNSFNKLRTQTIGVFRLTPEMDKKFIFAPFKIVQNLLHFKKNQVSAIEIRLQKDINSELFTEFLKDKLGVNYSVKTRKQLNESIYKMLNMEHFFSYLMATLIGIIAFFNVIGAILMIILDKKENIKTLFNMGLSFKKLKQIFFLQGFLLSIYGLVIGLVLAILFVLLQSKFGFIKINASLSYPVAFLFSNVLIVIATILSLGFIASFIASNRVSKKLIIPV